MGRERVLYLAGGCFWGVEALMARIPGVTHSCVGYANGTGKHDAVYETVCKGDTGFRETVRLHFDTATVDALLTAFFMAIDPTLVDRQGNDVGSQYQAGIYWEAGDEQTRREVERCVARAREAYPGFAVEVKELENFFEAEGYHQDYLIKNPQGYCHVSPALIAQADSIKLAEGSFIPPKPAAH